MAHSDGENLRFP